MMDLQLIQPGILADGGAALVTGLAIFAVAALAMSAGALIFGRFIRPRLPHPVKQQPYECGEEAVGQGWVQFDLRFYVVALVFLIFDVETALFFPWAVVWGKLVPSARWAAAADMLFFFAVIGVGFVYLWRFGYLDWVRAISGPGEPGKVPGNASERSAAHQAATAGWPVPPPPAATGRTDDESTT